MNQIQLPSPNTKGGKPFKEVLMNRRTSRNFSSQALSYQQLSDLLWAAFGFNREEKRTAPSSHNRQETDLFVALESGTYLYCAKDNSLLQINDKDLREASATQSYVKDAPVDIILVADKSKIIDKTPMEVIETIYTDTGFISQNIYLHCANEGLANVTRAKVPKESLSKLLDLKDNQQITLVHTIGHFAPID